MKTVLVKKEVYTFDELDQEGQDQAINEYIEFLMDIYDPDKPKENPPFVRRAAAMADRLQTPWFWGSYILEYGRKHILAALKEEYFFKDGHNFYEEIYQELPCENLPPQN